MKNELKCSIVSVLLVADNGYNLLKFNVTILLTVLWVIVIVLVGYRALIVKKKW